jgi:hypothetical protein
MNTINPDSVCFVGNANQPKYIDQFNTKISNLPKDFDFDFYICTDNPSLINQGYKKLKVFDLNVLQQRTPETLGYEDLKSGVKLRFYPSNIRRHIINQAFIDGFDYVVWSDGDALPIANKNTFLQELSTYSINSVHTQNAIFRFREDGEGNQQPFTNCDKVLKYLGLNSQKKNLKVHDGPTAIYYLDKKMQKSFIKSWDDITLYGYQKPFFLEGNHSRPNSVYTFIINNISLEYTKNKRLFRIKHDSSVWY